MLRATANADAEEFTRAGAELAAVLTAAVDTWHPAAAAVLDWGCGPGRVAAHIAAARPGWELQGCDIDGEATAWCDEHIRRGAYQQTGLMPPLPYPAGSFDVVIACSVFTHLQRDVQRAWLAEVGRVLRPGGVLAASVHGEPARRTYIPKIPRILEENGIFDDLTVGHLDGVAPAGYYRIVFQSEAWTRAEWGKYFTVVQYQESGLAPAHDLVVCLKGGCG
jgi:SAM-dependent methyltransferase